jgi:hypothetical protein
VTQEVLHYPPLAAFGVGHFHLRAGLAGEEAKSQRNDLTVELGRVLHGAAARLDQFAIGQLRIVGNFGQAVGNRGQTADKPRPCGMWTNRGQTGDKRADIHTGQRLADFYFYVWTTAASGRQPRLSLLSHPQTALDFPHPFH